MGRIVETVCGKIAPEDLGITSMHDHTLNDMDAGLMESMVQYGLTQGITGGLPPVAEEGVFDLRPENMYYARNDCMFFMPYVSCLHEGDVEKMRYELNAYKKVGGGTIVDCSTMETRADIRIIQKLSKETGVNIICATGMFHSAMRSAKYAAMSEDELYEKFLNEIENGVDGTDIKPEYVKTAVGSYGPDGINPLDLVSFRAGARAAAAAGRTLYVHTNNPVPYDAICDLADQAIAIGCEPGRIVMCHIDQASLRLDVAKYVNDINYTREIDWSLSHRLLEKGVVIGIDTCGNEMSHWVDSAYPDDFDRLRMLMQLSKEGYAEQLIIGHDLLFKLQRSSEGMQCYKRIPEYIIPKLKQYGMPEETLNQIVYKNPQRLMSH